MPIERDESTAAGPRRPPAILRVAMAQLCRSWAISQRNLALHLEQIEAARRQHADLIVFPELSLTGYFVRDMVPDLALSPARAGDPPVDRRGRADGDGGRTDRGVAAAPLLQRCLGPRAAGCSTSIARSICPPMACSTSSGISPPASAFMAFDTARFGRVGILVCEDFWHLSAAAIMQAEEVDVLVCVQLAGPRRRRPKVRMAETYELLAKTFAQLLGAAVIVVNRVGFEDGLCFWGGSMAVGPDGRTIAQAPMLDPAATGRVRSAGTPPAAAHHPLGPRRTAAGHR